MHFVWILLLVAAGSRVWACDPLPSGIVGWWPAESNATDVVAGNNGTLMNGTSFAPGEVGMAFNLNGVNNFVVANPSSVTNLDVGQGSGMTIEGWINPTTTPSRTMMLVEYERVLGGSGSDVGIQFVMNSVPNAGYSPGCLGVNLVDTTPASHTFGSAGNVLTAGVWQHIALTYDKNSGIAVLYTNGVPTAQAYFGTFTPQTSYTNLLFGASTYYNSPSSPDNVYSGLMDEMSLYNRALSSNEIAAIYLAGSSGKCTGSVPPFISSQPTNQAAAVGSTVAFNVVAGGSSPLYFQWSFNGTNLLNATNSTLTLTNIQISQSGNYSVLITNLYGYTNSAIAALTVYGLPPSITVQPTNEIVWVGSTAIFTVAATGTAPLAYQWSFDGTNISNATNNSLILTNVQSNQSGSYSVLITNLFGFTNSAIVSLAANIPPVCDPPPLGIVGWWPAESNALDSVAGNNGILMNGIGFAPGEVGTAFNFNGTTNFVRINPAAATNLDVGQGSGLTIEGWINPAIISSSTMMLVQYERVLGGSGSDVGVQFNMNSIPNGGFYPGCMAVNLVDTAGSGHVLGTTPNVLAAGIWQHIALTYDKTTGITVFYTNGVSVTRSNLGVFTPQTSFTNVLLGATTDYSSPASPGNVFSGQMDEISLYKRALSSNEIAAIYQASITGKCPLPPVIVSQPTNQVAGAGGTAAFSVAAAGSPVLSYQWQFNGTNLPSATNSSVMLTNLAQSQAGNYDVVVQNYAGSVTSSVAVLNMPFILVEVNGQPSQGTVLTVAPATITLLGGYPNGYIFYTLDGSTPTTSSTLYSAPFTLTNSAIIQTLALSGDFSQTSNGVPVTVQIIPTYTLQTSIVGSGTVSTNPPGGVYASNTVVTLTASPAAHWAFSHWAGDTNSTQNPLSVTMNGSHNIQAVFVQNAFPLTLTTPGGGSVTANGSVIPTSTYYPVGTVVTLAANPNSGWLFLGWQGSVTATNSPLNIVMNGTNVIQGIFGTMIPTNAAGGAIVLSQPNPVPYGTSLTLSAVPNPDDYLYGWTGYFNGTSLIQRMTVISANPSLGALFATLPAGQFSLAIIANGSGYVTYTPGGSYFPSNTLMTLTAVPNGANNFFGWSLGASGRTSPLQFHLTNNTVIQANFGVAPTVSILPPSQTVFAGSNATFTAIELGLPPLTNQWQSSQGPISGATTTNFTILNVQPTNAGNYSVVVSSSVGSVTSLVANLTVIGAPTITNPPAPVSVTVGHPASYAVGAYGAPTLAYQWRQNGAAVAGATNAALTISNAFAANAGLYTVAITNLYGSVTSTPVGLTVIPLNILLPAKQVNGQFQVTFDTASGVNYSLQYSTNLMDWNPWLNLGGNGQPVTLTDPSTSGTPNRFYRIVLTPQ